jgi:hypothetical protein
MKAIRPPACLAFSLRYHGAIVIATNERFQGWAFIEAPRDESAGAMALNYPQLSAVSCNKKLLNPQQRPEITRHYFVALNNGLFNFCLAGRT